ncbi:MAG: amidohydrolase family protein [Planctomycetota bacterium]|jgi:hypothetical protein
MNSKFEYTDFDQDFWNEHLEDFVPEKIYDMHAHLWTEKGQEHLPRDPDNGLRYEASLNVLKDWSSKVFPGRECAFLCLGTPVAEMNAGKHNEWLSGQIKQDDNSIGAMIVTPELTQEDLQKGFSGQGFSAVKPYRLFAEDPKDCRINDFLPESQLEVINHYGKAVMLHMAMEDGPDSPVNQQDLKNYTVKYPGIKWILAHCARGFNPMFLEKSIHFYKELPNIWYDTSAVNDLYTHILLLKHEDIGRIMFGSDNIAAGSVRGKYITRARSWDCYSDEKELPHCDSRLTFVIYEQLLAQKRAFETLQLNKSDIKKIFYSNAQHLTAIIKK